MPLAHMLPNAVAPRLWRLEAPPKKVLEFVTSHLVNDIVERSCFSANV